MPPSSTNSLPPPSPLPWSPSDIRLLLLSLHLSHAQFPHFPTLLPNHPISSIHNLLLRLTLPTNPTANTWSTSRLAATLLQSQNGTPHPSIPHPRSSRRGRVVVRLTPFSNSDAAQVRRKGHNPKVEVLLRGVRPVWDIVKHLFIKWGLAVRLRDSVAEVTDFGREVFGMVEQGAERHVVALKFVILDLNINIDTVINFLEKGGEGERVGGRKRICAPVQGMGGALLKKKRTPVGKKRERLAVQVAHKALSALGNPPAPSNAATDPTYRLLESPNREGSRRRPHLPNPNAGLVAANHRAHQDTGAQVDFLNGNFEPAPVSLRLNTADLREAGLGTTDFAPPPTAGPMDLLPAGLGNSRACVRFADVELDNGQRAVGFTDAEMGNGSGELQSEESGEKAVMERLQGHLRKLQNGQGVGAEEESAKAVGAKVRMEGMSCGAVIPEAFLKSGSGFEIPVLATLPDSLLPVGKSKDIEVEGDAASDSTGGNHSDNASDGIDFGLHHEQSAKFGAAGLGWGDAIPSLEEGKSLNLSQIFRDL